MTLKQRRALAKKLIAADKAAFERIDVLIRNYKRDVLVENLRYELAVK